jgi:D-arabinose 1-dehydrogenase-like Zn-dependent alcohol dehydrogenase
VDSSNCANDVSSVQLIVGSRSIQGWASRTATDCEYTLTFSVLSGVRPMIETMPLEHTAEAHERMRPGKARFRTVLTTER